MNTKKTIVLDFDDTLVKSSEQVIKMLNEHNGTNKTIDDLKDWGYRSIDKSLDDKKVFELFESVEFFQTLKFNLGVFEFFQTFKNTYDFIICSKGTKLNLELKQNYCRNILSILGVNYKFCGVPLDFNNSPHNMKKSMYDFSDCVFGIDDNIQALMSLNAQKKILIKNYKNLHYNRLPKNSENIYAVNDFYDIINLIKIEEVVSKID